VPAEGFTADLPGVCDVKERPKDAPSVGHRMPPGSNAPRTLRFWGRWPWHPM
jgi:hypothetical protein